MISVIITTHQGRLEMLKNAVKSVQEQTFTDWELIVVNDGATDGTKAYLDSIASEKIRPVHRSKAFGNDTRPKNRGAKEARGEYIAYLDSDNAYRSDHLQALYNAIIRNDVDVVYGDRMVKVNGEAISIGVHSDFAPLKLMIGNYIDTSDVLIKKESLFEVGGWDERYGKYVDWNLFARMAKHGMKFLRVPLIITDYNIHDKQKSATVHTKGDDEKKGLFIPEWNPFEVEIDLPFLHTPKEPKVAIFSLTKDRLKYTKECFKSMKDKAGYPYTHVVVDNGSSDSTVEWLKQQEDIIPLFNKGNRGISLASNQALEYLNLPNMDFDIIIKVDNDCKFLTSNWLKEVVELYKRNHMMCFAPYPEGLKDSPGGTPRTTYGQLNKHYLGITTHLGGLCHIAPAKVYKTFRWDETSPLHGIQDLELSQWLTKNGYQQAYIEDIRVEHYLTTQGQHEDMPEYFELRKKEKYETNRK